ncbi:hypothetical protein [Bizionia algoritergicola]|uniref:Uncharacterized protein n=1 Tax=Bizionia algoritergicola TaxID=291187 RepID=A0A5D0QPD3_9FLAO|nr:hypothetical protein [Bizionia algoritergicola]OBX18063.1 hypothetical protein BAA08_15625 [Bizionia sp. APA-3]TYB70014.1 hypothetical protein ES675_16015 [Bizionia algoritergicola]
MKYKWIPKDWTEAVEKNPENFNEKPNWEYDLFCAFLRLKNTEKSKGLLEELKHIKTNQDWMYFKLNSKFESFLKAY